MWRQVLKVAHHLPTEHQDFAKAMVSALAGIGITFVEFTGPYLRWYLAGITAVYTTWKFVTDYQRKKRDKDSS